MTMKLTDNRKIHKTGWDKDHFIYKCSDGEHQSFWATIIRSPQWEVWEKENSRRMHLKPIGNCFDVDECRECGWMSDQHFQEFIKFIKKEE